MWPFRRKRGTELFRSHELAVIQALRAALRPEAADLYDRQVDALEMVQRLLRDQEVNSYPRRRGSQVYDPAFAFVNRTHDLKLATIELLGPRGTGKVSSTPSTATSSATSSARARTTSDCATRSS